LDWVSPDSSGNPFLVGLFGMQKRLKRIAGLASKNKKKRLEKKRLKVKVLLKLF